MVVEEEEKVELTDLVLSLQATPVQFKKLFRLRDDAQAFLEDISRMEMDTCDTIALCAKFYAKFSSYSSMNVNVKLADEDWPLITKEDGDLKVMDLIVPIKLKFKASAKIRNSIGENLDYILEKLTKKYEFHRSQIDLYLVILEIFYFILQNRDEISTFFNKGRKFRNDNCCEVCGDAGLDPENFCGCSVCGKCIRFFIRNVTGRADLKCRSLGRCQVERKRKLDITCKKCRMARCTALGMVEEYYSDVQKEATWEPNTCAVCGGAPTQRRCKNVLGFLLCLECKGFFHRSIYKNTYESYACEIEENCEIKRDYPPREDKMEPCAYCLFNKFEKIGFLQKYLCKKKEVMEGDNADSNSSMDDNDDDDDEISCVVCSRQLITEEEQEPWMGLNCCAVCKTFLKLSMVGEVRFDYTCQTGEMGKLCNVDPNHESWTGKCNFCWFRIMEIEGLVERWIICDGNPNNWKSSRNVSMSDSNDSFSDGRREVESEDGEEEKAKGVEMDENEIEDLLNKEDEEEAENDDLNLELELENLEKELEEETEQMLKGGDDDEPETKKKKES